MHVDVDSADRDPALLHEVTEDDWSNDMKKEARKLSLNRETLAPLQDDNLANVNGGTSTFTHTITKTLTTRTTNSSVPSMTRGC
jgi:hypothetical protein